MKSCLNHHSPFTIHHSSFTIHHSPFTIHHSPFTIHHSSFTIDIHARLPLLVLPRYPARLVDLPAGLPSLPRAERSRFHPGARRRLAYLGLRLLAAGFPGAGPKRWGWGCCWARS